MDVYRCLTAALFLMVMLTACSTKSPQLATVPDTLTLYSIDGGKERPASVDKDKEAFRGYPVIGKVDVTDAKAKKALMDALKEGMDASDGQIAGCFRPRHAIRASTNGQTTDYVICFECTQLQVYTDDKPKTETITRKPKSVFNTQLKTAKIPLAP